MNVLFHCGGDDRGRMQRAVIEALPDCHVRVWPDVGSPELIDYAAVWQPPPDFFDGLTGLRAVFCLAAGVDALLQHPGLSASVPIVRLDDAGMARKMAEYVLYGVLHAQRRFGEMAEARRRADWSPDLGSAAADRFPVGILGAGTLASAVAERLALNGYPVTCWARSPRELPAGVACVSGDDGLRTLLPVSRALVCLLPLTEATHGILNRELFDALPAGAFLINAARGEHLIETDLLAALDQGRLSGALLDVFTTEPLPPTHPFWQRQALVLTPHVAAPSGARESAAQVARSLAQFQAGERPSGWVDRERGY